MGVRDSDWVGDSFDDGDAMGKMSRSVGVCERHPMSVSESPTREKDSETYWWSILLFGGGHCLFCQL